MKQVKNWAIIIGMAGALLSSPVLSATNYGTNIPIKPIKGSEGRQFNHLLFDAAKKGLTDDVKKYLTLGGSVEARDRFGNTALLLAAFSGKYHTVQTLLDAGSDVHHRNLRGSTPIYRAAQNGNSRSVKILLAAGANVKELNIKRLTPLIAAAYNGDRRMLDLFLQKGADPSVIDTYGKTAAIYAAGRGFHDIVGALLDIGIDINKAYGNNLTVLMWAAGFSNDVPPKDGEAMVKMLLARGADVTLRDNRGWTALTTAAHRNHDTIIGLLIKAGANPKVRSASGKTPLDIARAAKSQKAARAIIEATDG